MRAPKIAGVAPNSSARNPPSFLASCVCEDCSVPSPAGKVGKSRASGSGSALDPLELQLPSLQPETSFPLQGPIAKVAPSSRNLEFVLAGAAWSNWGHRNKVLHVPHVCLPIRRCKDKLSSSSPIKRETTLDSPPKKQYAWASLHDDRICKSRGSCAGF